MRLFIATLMAGFAITTANPPATAAGAERKVKCPPSRAFLEPQLKTRPEDGRLYQIQRQAIRVPIADLVKAMGGPQRAHAIAAATKANAESRLGAGAEGAAKRFWEDTILRADALIAILTCMGHAPGTAT